MDEVFIDELLKTSRGLQQVYIGKNTGNSFSYAITNRELSQTVNNRIVDPIKRLSSLILFTDYKLPMDYGNGLVNTKLEIGRTKWGNYVVYIYDCDEDMIDIELLQNNALMKEMLLEKNNTDNPATSYFRKTCKNAGFGIAYLYVGKTSGKVAEIFLPTDELK